MRLKQEHSTFERLLPELLKDHAGRHALIQGDECLGVYDTFAECLGAGFDRFGRETPFLIKEITAQDNAVCLTTLKLS